MIFQGLSQGPVVPKVRNVRIFVSLVIVLPGDGDRDSSGDSLLMIAEATPQSVPILRAVGILNLLVGGALLLCGGSGLWLLGPTLAGMSPFGLDPFLTREVVASLRDQMIEDEKAQGLQVTDPALKERMRKSREALESTPRDLDKEIDFAKINACLPWLSHYLWVEVLSAPILNLLLTLSGIGLIAS